MDKSRTQRGEFGAELRAIRESVKLDTGGKLSIGALARQLGVSSSYISDVELGYRAPLAAEKLDKAVEFLRELGASVERTGRLFALASLERNAVNLRIDDASEQQIEVALGLMKRWGRLSPEELKRIADVLSSEDDIHDRLKS